MTTFAGDRMLSELTVPPVTHGQKRRAALTVCARAVDASEAAVLLAMLGMLPYERSNPGSRRVGPQREAWVPAEYEVVR